VSDYQLCTPGDRNFLKAATSLGNEAINNIIKSDVIENEISCVVSSPKMAFPAVCGTGITDIRTYVIQTKTDATYSIVVNASYTSCARMRVVPMVQKLTFSPTIKPVFFP
jgi:hypothetical protein